MEPQMTPELQGAQDILTAVIQQRDAALNATAQLQAQIIGLQRQLAEKEEAVAVKAKGLPTEKKKAK
jgi:hypothetical protein